MGPGSEFLFPRLENGQHTAQLEGTGLYDRR
jgi:hypothetical protein